MTAPGTHFSPAVQYGYALHTVGYAAFDIVIQFPEFIADRFYIIYKFWKIQCQLQISAVSDSVYGFTQDRTAGSYPVDFRLLDRVPALMEGIREKVGQKPAFRIPDPFDIADEPESRAVPHAPYDCVQSHMAELVHKGLGSDPVVSQEHHGLLAAFVGDIHHLFYDLCHFPSLECLEILVFFGWDAVLVIVIALVDDIFRAKRIPGFPLKLLQDIGAYGCRVAVPVYIFFTGHFIKY